MLGRGSDAMSSVEELERLMAGEAAATPAAKTGADKGAKGKAGAKASGEAGAEASGGPAAKKRPAAAAGPAGVRKRPAGAAGLVAKPPVKLPPKLAKSKKEIVDKVVESFDVTRRPDGGVPTRKFCTDKVYAQALAAGGKQKDLRPPSHPAAPCAPPCMPVVRSLRTFAARACCACATLARAARTVGRVARVRRSLAQRAR